MEKKRKAYAPFSLTSEAGVGQTPVEGYVDVNQMIYPSVDTGVIDENGEWKGVKANDKEFIAFTKDETIPNTGDLTLFGLTRSFSIFALLPQCELTIKL